MRTAPRSILFVTAVGFVIALTGCSGGGQSVVEACKLFADEGTKITADAQTAVASAGADTKAAFDTLADIQKKFVDLGDKITNEQFKPVYTDFVEAYGSLSEVVRDAAKDPANAAQAMEKVAELSTKIQDADAKMHKLCP